MFRYEVIIYWSSEDGAFVAEVPELPGCAAHGDSYESALASAQQAIQLWVKTAKEFGDPIPEPKEGASHPHREVRRRLTTRANATFDLVFGAACFRRGICRVRRGAAQLESVGRTAAHTYASCSLWRTSTIRSPGSANAARRSSARWSSIKTGIGSATSGVPKEILLGLAQQLGRQDVSADGSLDELG